MPTKVVSNWFNRRIAVCTEHFTNKANDRNRQTTNKINSNGKKIGLELDMLGRSDERTYM